MDLMESQLSGESKEAKVESTQMLNHSQRSLDVPPPSHRASPPHLLQARRHTPTHPPAFSHLEVCVLEVVACNVRVLQHLLLRSSKLELGNDLRKVWGGHVWQGSGKRHVTHP